MRWWSSLVAVAAAASIAAPSAATCTAADVPPDAIAIVAGEPIPRAGFDALLAQARAAYARSKRTFPAPGTEAYEQLERQIVAFLVQRTKLRQKGRELGIEITDAQVGERLRQIKRQYFGGSETRYRRELRRQGVTEEQLRDDIRYQLLSEALFRRVTAGVRVTAGEVAAYYRSHRRQFVAPPSRTVRHIMVRTRARALAIRRRLRAGQSFAALARRYSLDPGTRRTGGRLTIARGQTVRQFDRAAFSLRRGEVSRPVKTRYGWHVIQALSVVRPRRLKPLREVSKRIRARLLTARRNRVMSDWLVAVEREYQGKVCYGPGFEPRPVPAGVAA